MQQQVMQQQIKLAFLLIALVSLTLSCLIGCGGSKIVEKEAFIKNTAKASQEITIKRGMVTTLQFNSLINYYVLGDDLVAEANQINPYTLIVAAKQANEATNLNVATNEGNFVFVLKTIDYDSGKEPDLHLNIGGKIGKILKPQELDKLVKKQKPKENPNFDYVFSMYSEIFCGFLRFCRYEEIAPQRVWTDGTYTYLDYNSTSGINKDIPHVMEVKDRIDTPLNYTIKDNIIVVHTLSKKIIIKAGSAYICIEYRGVRYEAK